MHEDLAGRQSRAIAQVRGIDGEWYPIANSDDGFRAPMNGFLSRALSQLYLGFAIRAG